MVFYIRSSCKPLPTVMGMRDLVSHLVSHLVSGICYNGFMTKERGV